VYADIPEELRGWIEPVVTDHGLELVDVDFTRGRAPWRVRVVVDTPAGDGRVSIDVCAAVSREVGAQLEAHDAISAPYTLEVTSPGFDRVLAREKDFRAACGGEVKLKTRQAIDGQRSFRGLLEAFEAGVARLRVDGREVTIPFGDVAKANAVYEFSREDFARA
jgi:ribosome maturation factor RimP